MSRETIHFIDAIAHEKNLPVEEIFAAIEGALASAMKKQFKEGADVVVRIDRDTGQYVGVRRWEVVPDEHGIQEPERQEIFSDAVEDYPDIKVGEFIEEPLEPQEFGRIGAQIAKQVILQKIRDSERKQLIDEFVAQNETIVSGIVKRIDKGDVIVEIGKLEARLPKTEMIPKENFRIGDRVRAFVQKIDKETKGQIIQLSCIDPEFLKELFEYEVPEIEQGLLEIKAAARDPGLRAKIAVQAYDKRIDPIGTCVGMRGSRVGAVRHELNGEQIDIVLWSDEPAEFVISALSPAHVSSIIVDEEKHTMDVVVDEDNLAKAIGTRGQNVRLASELTGWQINIMTPEQSQARQEEEDKGIMNLFTEKLDIDEEIASILIQEGFTGLEEVAYVPEQELLEIEGFDEELVHELRNRARHSLSIAAAERDERVASSEGLMDIEGLNADMVSKLVLNGINNRDDLAELATDELLEILDIDEKSASEIILKARAHWFE